MNTSIRVVVNGRQHDLNGPATVLDLIESLQLDPRAVAVEVNRMVIRRATLSDVELSDGDQVELVHFVGGG